MMSRKREMLDGEKKELTQEEQSLAKQIKKDLNEWKKYHKTESERIRQLSLPPEAYVENEELATKELKNQIIDTASNIGHAFAGINKAELNKMAALTLLFNK